MKHFLSKNILCLFLLICSFMFASKDLKKDYSEGTLIVNKEKLPVKIYASTDYKTFDGFADKNEGLVIINDANFRMGSPDEDLYFQSVVQHFIKNDFQFLTEDFVVETGNVNLNNVKNYKYLYKSNKKLHHDDLISLDTPFKIWDPATFIKIGPLKLHYYSLMFIIAFGLGYFLMYYIFKIDNVNEKYLEPLFTYTLIGTILGARLGHVIFYQPELFKEDFWSVFLPIRTNPTFEFTGFSGLASHGATIMLLGTTYYYAKKIIKKNPLWVYDRIGIVVALGGCFVRIGNYFNSEIIGKPTFDNMTFATLFPQMSDEYGITIPRYPTQLFESVGYLLLFYLLWYLYRYTKKKYEQGFLFGVFFFVLWLIRLGVEFLKEPQGDEFIQIGVLNTGQVLSIPFMALGLYLIFTSKKHRITELENEKPIFENKK